MPTQVCQTPITLTDISERHCASQDQSKCFFYLCLTDSELQIALVALFSEMLYRFPNLVVAQVTRESVQQAISNGITAQQVSVACSRCNSETIALQTGFSFY